MGITFVFGDLLETKDVDIIVYHVSHWPHDLSTQFAHCGTWDLSAKLQTDFPGRIFIQHAAAIQVKT